ncbi:hypothetical protein Aoki45_29930 [Algoriphagus sp. oki45]|uniref:hypothetical protein n=1 Tax=Algoriphagus sp. oki45 TaxID=3067294 RepID=UPI0027EAE6E4|nr:hypothetical protein Aoki45_29930 [Algoriphagus sp. oki45]
MKIRLCLTLSLIIFLSSLNQVQCQSIEEDQFYAELKKIVSKTAMLNPFDSTGRKYISFSYEVRIGNEASIKISEHAPWGSRNRIEKLKDDLVNYIESQGKEIDNELIIIYPVLFNFDYLIDDSNNLGTAIESLIIEPDQTNCPRIESPIYVVAKKPQVN